jgi:hypothetical protein
MLAVTNVQLAIFFFTRRRIENHTFNPASVSCALAMLTIQNTAANKVEPGVLISSFSRYVLYPNLIPQGNYRSGYMRKNDYLRNLAPPVGLVDVEAIALHDDCLHVRGEVTFNDLSLTGTGTSITVHKD